MPENAKKLAYIVRKTNCELKKMKRKQINNGR